VRKTQRFQQVITYRSSNAGGFILYDTMRIPRPCAYKSFNLTAVDYYRGQNNYTYKISANNSHTYAVTMMSETSKMIFHNGQPTEPLLATYDRKKYSVNIYTHSEDMVGRQRTMIRDCDAMGRLLELNLYIDVKENTPPDFTYEMNTYWEMDFLTN